MSWTVTINDLNEYRADDGKRFWRLPEVSTLVEHFLTQHPLYPEDMALALAMALNAGLESAVLTGMRTPTPDGSDEVIDISVRGMVKATDFVGAIKRIIDAGPAAGG